jgi:hypothetical protein
MITRATIVALAFAAWMAPVEAAAQSCECTRRTADGDCYRWYEAQVPWSIYAPAELPGGIKNADFEANAKAAFAAWEGLQCSACMGPTAKGCGPVPCDANPLGPRFPFQGYAAKPTLACVFEGKQTAPASECPGSQKNTVQLAFIRNEAEWPMGSKIVSAVLFTTLQKGKLQDADLVVRDNGHVFCLDKCNEAQYHLGGVLLREVGHLMGVGQSDNAVSILAANFKLGTVIQAQVPSGDAECVCQIYRTTPFKELCETPHEPAPQGCMAFTARSGRPQPALPDVWLSIFALSFAVLGLRRTLRNE